MKRWILTCLATLGLLILVAGAVASPAAVAQPADNGGPGNSGAANLCQEGNWKNLARAEASRTAFLNQDECVSYGAQGGTLVEYVAPTVIASMANNGAGYCVSQITATGFLAETEYAAYYLYRGQYVDAGTIETDANGNWSGPSGSALNGSTATFQFVIDGVYSNVVTYSC